MAFAAGIAMLVGTRIAPHVRAIAAMAAKPHVIDMRSASVLPDKTQLMAGSLRRAHAGIRLGPDCEV